MPTKRSDRGTDSFNPARGQLQSMRECLEQLHGALPSAKEEYLKADRMTHALVKSCVLMLIQRAIDTNSVVIEAGGERPPSRKLQTFLAIWNTGAIRGETLAFFQKAVDFYQKMVKDEDLSYAEIHDVARGLLKHGRGYVDEIERFFAKADARPECLDVVMNRREEKCQSERKKVKSSLRQTTVSETATDRETPALVEANSLPKNDEEEIKENYKGKLQTVCMRRGLGRPTYHTKQRGTPHKPIWMVLVQYGNNAYTIPSPIPGGKKHAEQIAAKQTIEQLSTQPTPSSTASQSEEEAGIGEKMVVEDKQIEVVQTLTEQEPINIQKEIKKFSREIGEEPLLISSDLTAEILDLASGWLSRSNRGKQYLRALDTPEVRNLMGLDLADLTFRLIRGFLTGAQQHNVEMVNSPEKAPAPERVPVQEEELDVSKDAE